MTKPKTDNTSMGNPPTGTYFKEDKQGWVDELYRLDVGDPDSKGCTISLGEYLRTDCPELEGFISDLLSLQREEVRREVVEEITTKIRTKRKELWKFYHEAQLWEEQKQIIRPLDELINQLALSSDGEKKGVK